MCVVKNLALLQPYLDSNDIHRLSNSASTAEKLEAKYRSKMKSLFQKVTERTAMSILRHGSPMYVQPDFLDIIMEHWFEVTQAAYRISVNETELRRSPYNKLARKMPTKLPDLMFQWDSWRKRRISTKSQRDIADKLKQMYLAKVQSVWEKHSHDFVNGSIVQKEEIALKMAAEAQTTYARGKTIVDTETTRYYNKVRRDFYDKSNDVTHYLFVAIRDHRTTKWCKSRHFVVYEKGSLYLDKETPPIHWSCRSELLPLTALNPRHLILIKDASKQRKNRNPEPLPKGWGSLYAA